MERDLLSEKVNFSWKEPVPLREMNNGTSSLSSVEVAFRNIEDFIVNAIREYECVMGCVAWMTNRAILAALASRNGANIILQKEDFLRPDRGGPKTNELRRLYSAVPSFLDGNNGHIGMNWRREERIMSFRCAGYVADKNVTVPRMHNKFLVLCGPDSEWKASLGQNYPRAYHRMRPQAVITGSFNMTENATRSLENVVLIRSHEIAKAYFEEFRSIFAISEPLNWKHKYVSPQYDENPGTDGIRIGS